MIFRPQEGARPVLPLHDRLLPVRAPVLVNFPFRDPAKSINRRAALGVSKNDAPAESPFCRALIPQIATEVSDAHCQAAAAHEVVLRLVQEEAYPPSHGV